MTSKMPVQTRVASTFLALSLLLAGLGILLLKGSYADLAVVLRERQGVALLNQIQPLLELIPEYHGVCTTRQRGAKGQSEHCLSARQRIDQTFAGLDAHRLEALTVAHRFATLRAQWEQLSDERLDTSMEAYLSEYNLLLNRLHEASEDVGEYSNLTLDPEPLPYHLINIVINYQPGIIDSLGQIRSLGSQAIAAGHLDAQKRLEIVRFTGQLNHHLQRAQRLGENIREHNKAVAAKLKPVMQEIDFQTSRLLARLNADLLSGDIAKLHASDFFTMSSQPIEPVFQLYRASLAQLDEILQARENRIRRILILSFLTLGLIALFLFFLYRRFLASIEQLQTSETQTRAILHTMLEGVVHIDANGIILRVNDTVCRMFGYAEKELVGRNVSLLMPEPHRSAHDGYLRHYLETRRAGILGRRAEMTGKRKDGGVFALEQTVNELIDDTGSSFISVIHDITERKALESAREAALEEAEQLARIKSEFLANMSHEIRTPLGAVLGLARIGMRENQGRKAHDTCAHILESGQHLLAVVDDILDFSKIEAGKLTVDAQPMRLADTLSLAVRMVTNRAAAKGLVLESRLSPDLPAWVMGDTLRIRQILVNLLSNAVKFTEHGRVTLTVQRKYDQIQFAVGDAGIGMTEEQVSRLFQPFEQADGSTTRKFGGTGLGLTISMNLARLMKGDIQVTSAPGRGSTFTLTLPLPETPRPADADAPDAIPERTARPLAGLKLLAAEDVDINRLILANLLDEQGATCVFAENGKEALEYVKADPAAFDAVLMDVQMPIMDGHTATRLIHEIVPGLPVIGLTAHAMAEEREKCHASGMVDHVTKPIDPAELITAILRWTKRREIRASASPTNAVPPAPSIDGPIDWATLQARFKGKTAFIRKLAQTVLADHADMPDKLRRLAAAEDFAGLAFLAHSLKGLAGNLAAGATHELAAAVEKAANEGDAETLILSRQLADSVGAMIDALRAFTRNNP